MGPLGVTLAAILDEEAGNSMSHGVSIYRNYLIFRGWTEGLDLAGLCQLPSARHVHTHASRSSEPRCGCCHGLADPQCAVLQLDRFYPAEENVTQCILLRVAISRLTSDRTAQPN